MILTDTYTTENSNLQHRQDKTINNTQPTMSEATPEKSVQEMTQDVLEILFEKKKEIGDGDYIQLCDLLKKIYEKPSKDEEKQQLRVKHYLRKKEEVIDFMKSLVEINEKMEADENVELNDLKDIHDKCDSKQLKTKLNNIIRKKEKRIGRFSADTIDASEPIVWNEKMWSL